MAGPGRPQPDLDVQWRSHSCLLLRRDGTQELQDQMVAIRTASHRAVRVMEALRRDHPATVPASTRRYCPGVCRRQRRWATVHGAGRRPGGRRATPCMRRPPMMRPLTSRFASPWPLRSRPLVGVVGDSDDGAVPGSAGWLPWGRCRATNWGRCATAVGCGGSPGGHARCPGGVASPPATI
jgi:hypothetical protein